VLSAFADRWDVSFAADAVGGLSKYAHDVAVDRMVAAGAVPHTTTAPITEWFRDWDSPLAPAARGIFTPFLKETKELTFAIVIAATNWL
jgi:hypothetical protein